MQNIEQNRRFFFLESTWYHFCLWLGSYYYDYGFYGVSLRLYIWVCSRFDIVHLIWYLLMWICFNVSYFKTKYLEDKDNISNTLEKWSFINITVMKIFYFENWNIILNFISYKPDFNVVHKNMNIFELFEVSMVKMYDYSSPIKATFK